ncbi:serine hydrolase domain-containing protein [Pseudonocardia xinjiangensis]|uniref:serine hydrolase domain-containing protein n=1 Tax=Pseudonocardia xinjiangensis TaxID=75289 RepID=UPI003D924671
MIRHAPHGRSSRGTRATALAAAGAVAALLAGCGAAAPATTPAPPIPASDTATLTAPDVDAWLDGLVPAALDRSGIAGAAVTVVHNGQVLSARGFGYADSGSEGTPSRPVDPDRTLFRVGSVSKVFVATAVMQLVEQGKIDLDADVGRYLDFPLPRTFDRAVTMRHLLSHTAGFEERLENIITLGETTVNLRDTVAVEPPDQVFEPGTVPAYSNYGYALAGYVVERVSGTPFDDHVERTVLGRAGMTSSSFAQPLPPELRSRLSHGYATDSGPAAPFETVGPAPAGALTASATDMGRFILAHLGEAGPEQTLLRPGTAALMRQPALDSTSLGTLADGPRMALGLFDESRNGHRIVGHGGDTQYFHSHLQIYPDDRTGVFVTLNSTGRGATDTLDLRQSLLDGFADRYFPAAAASAAPRTATATSHAAMAAGTYENARAPFSTFLSALTVTGQTRVTARGDGTVLIEPGPLSLYPALYEEIRPWVWQEVGGRRIVTMRAAGDRVEAINVAAAFTLLPTGAARDAGIAVPVLLASAAVLLISLLTWPVGAIVRRRHSLPAPASLGRVGRTARILTRVAAAAGVLALAGWAVVIVTISGLQDLPAPLIHALQAAQWVALAGVVPAAVGLVVAVRRRAGRAAVLGSVFLLPAMVGISWFALVFGLLSPSVSY